MGLQAEYVETIKVDGYDLPFMVCQGKKYGIEWYEVGDGRIFMPNHYPVSKTLNLHAYFDIDRYLSRQGL